MPSSATKNATEKKISIDGCIDTGYVISPASIREGHFYTNVPCRAGCTKKSMINQFAELPSQMNYFSHIMKI